MGKLFDRDEVMAATIERRVGCTLAWAIPILEELANIESVTTDDPHLAAETNALAINMCKIVTATLELRLDDAEALHAENETLVESWFWKTTTKHATKATQ